MKTVPAPRIDYDGRALVASHGSHTPKRIVLHDTEGHDVAGIRDLAGIALFWHGISWGPGSQIGVDAEGFSARYVDDLKIGYHVENHNTGSLGIEQVGFASFTAGDWLARPRQLDEVAHWIAHWATTYSIPIRLDVEHGVSTHAMQSQAYHGSHTDPGRGYPLARVLGLAEAIAAGDAKATPKAAYSRASFYLWLAWDLGEGDFAGDPHNLKRRPQSLPPIGDPIFGHTWLPWKRTFLQRRRASSRPRA